AGEVAVAGPGAAQLVTGRIGDGIVVHQVQTDGAVVAACANRYCVGGAAACHIRDGSAADPAGRQAEVARVHAGNAFTERDGEIHAARVGRVAVGAIDRG